MKDMIFIVAFAAVGLAFGFRGGRYPAAKLLAIGSTSKAVGTFVTAVGLVFSFRRLVAAAFGSFSASAAGQS